VLGLAIASPALAEDTVSGRSGIRPYLGVTSHLDVDSTLTPLGGTKFLFGADYLFGPGVGFTGVVGFRLGAGDQAVTFQPLLELHYRWASLYPTVPWIGGGVSFKWAFASDGFNLAVTGRFVAGVEYFASDSLAIGMQFALPDLGVRFTPSSAAVGNIEVLIGPHFRF
jgi:hypothetical protein